MQICQEYGYNFGRFRFRGQIVNYQGPGSADSGMPKFDRLKKIGERVLYWAYLQFYFKKMYQCKWKGIYRR